MKGIGLLKRCQSEAERKRTGLSYYFEPSFINKGMTL